MKLRITRTMGGECPLHGPREIKFIGLWTQMGVLAGCFDMYPMELVGRDITLTVHKPVRKRYVRINVTEPVPDSSPHAWVRCVPAVAPGLTYGQVVCSGNLKTALGLEFIPPHFYIILHPAKNISASPEDVYVRD